MPALAQSLASRSTPKTGLFFSGMADSLEREFSSKGLEWPARFVYIRAFKLEKQLEVWVKNDAVEPFHFFKMYKVCATSGTFGPKRKEGDKQIPEGFYYINEFNPNSNYHLALGLNYPNAADQKKSDPVKPGGDIYIHGSCVTVGCLPMTDAVMDELYYLTSVAKSEGQDFIPVHIYPYRFDYQISEAQYKQKTAARKDLDQFNTPLKEAYNFFEDTHQLPAIIIQPGGEYHVAKNPYAPKFPRKKLNIAEDKIDPYAAWSPEDKVDQVPTLKNGTAAFQRWLFQLTKELSEGLPENTSMFLQVQFLVDKDGSTRLPKVIKGGNAAINQIVEERFQKQLFWNPALKAGEPVATKMLQNINLVAREDLD
jgi:murein L,D-transpeptidase YafK